MITAQQDAEGELAQALYRLNNAAEIYLKTNDHARGIACLEAAVQAAPNSAQAHNNLAFALQSIGRHTDALTIVREGLALNPLLQQLHHNLGQILTSLDDEPGAIAAYRRAVELDAKCAASHLNLALLLFRANQWREAFREYEWRFEGHEEKLGKFRARYTKPQWRGELLTGKRIVVYNEQGMGDAIQFCRFLYYLHGCEADQVIVEVPFELSRLLEGQRGIDEIALRDFNIDAPASLPEHDYVVSICSLPYWFLPERFPPFLHPYLDLDILIHDWAGHDRPKFKPTSSLPKIALVWAGSPAHPNDDERSIPFKNFEALAHIQATFYSLQKTPYQKKFDCDPPPVPVHSLSGHISDFYDTACLIDQMDLVISCDTAIAHLAGALGKPVWILLPYKHDWRWPVEGDSTPWYPTMRIFRQSSARDWDEVLQKVKIALEQQIKGVT